MRDDEARVARVTAQYRASRGEAVPSHDAEMELRLRVGELEYFVDGKHTPSDPIFGYETLTHKWLGLLKRVSSLREQAENA